MLLNDWNRYLRFFTIEFFEFIGMSYLFFRSCSIDLNCFSIFFVFLKTVLFYQYFWRTTFFNFISYCWAHFWIICHLIIDRIWRKARTSLSFKFIQKVIIILFIKSLQNIENIPLLRFLCCLIGFSLAVLNDLLVCWAFVYFSQYQWTLSYLWRRHLLQNFIN